MKQRVSKGSDAKKGTVKQLFRKTYSFSPKQVSYDVLAGVLRFCHTPLDEVLPPCGHCLQYRDLASR